MSLSLIFWLTVIIAIVSFWWQSDRIKHLALQFVHHHCKTKKLQLLDQTMVLSGLWFGRDDQGDWGIRRRYSFEFSSTGETRNQGVVTLIGTRLQSFELEAHILPAEPSDEERLH